MSIYHNAKNDRQYKSATGLSIKEFEVLYSNFEKLYTPKKGNPYQTNRVPVLTDKREALFFILHYFKAYPTLQNMGLYFGISDYATCNYITLLKPILKSALIQSTAVIYSVFNNQQSFDEAFSGVEGIFMDVTEIPIERPDNQGDQKDKYSGKKNVIH